MRMAIGIVLLVAIFCCVESVSEEYILADGNPDHGVVELRDSNEANNPTQKAAEKEAREKESDAEEKAILIARIKKMQTNTKVAKANVDMAQKASKAQHAAAMKHANADLTLAQKKLKSVEFALQQAKLIASMSLKKLDDEEEAHAKSVREMKRATKELEVDHTSALQAQHILDETEAELEKANDDYADKVNILENVNQHEDDARLESVAASRKADYEKGEAVKISRMLKQMEAKKEAAEAFTNTLQEKADRDARAAASGISKAKGDYDDAMAKYQAVTNKVAKVEIKKTHISRELSKATEGVIMDLQGNNDAGAIGSAETHAFLQNEEVKLQKVIDDHNFEAAGHEKMMTAAGVERKEAEKLEMLARTQKERVISDRQTMKLQVEKIDFLTKEAKAATLRAEDSETKAKKALNIFKNIRTVAIDNKEKAEAQKRFLQNIQIPMIKEQIDKAKGKVRTSEFRVKRKNQDITAHTMGITAYKKEYTTDNEKVREIEAKQVVASAAVDGLIEEAKQNAADAESLP